MGIWGSQVTAAPILPPPPGVPSGHVGWRVHFVQNQHLPRLIVEIAARLPAANAISKQLAKTACGR
jgi:hypothetical protein